MKQSLFTVSVTDDDGDIILYHTLSQALAVCPASLDQAASIKLQQAGFFVEDDADETDRLIERYKKDCTTTKHFCLAITPTLECNFACPYCYEREVRHPGIMNERTQNATIAFIKRNFNSLGSKKVKIVWYGGEPLLGMPVIEHISKCLIKDGIPLEASMLSNISLVTPEIAASLAACNVTSVSTTLDGTDATHNIHRPTRSGTPSYVAIKEGIKLLKEQGIDVTVLFNEDRGNTGEYEKLRADLAPLGITNITASQVFDYCQCLDKTPDFTNKRYPLFTNPKEFAEKQYRRLAEDGVSDELFAQFMAPLRLYCSRQVNTYFVVDERGNLYECDGDVGHKNRVLGSVFDSALPSHGPYNPYTDPLCEACAFLPLCLGNCRWTRQCVGESCAPQKAIIREILHNWRAVLELGTEGCCFVNAENGCAEGGMKAAQLLNESFRAAALESAPSANPSSEEDLTAINTAEVRILRTGSEPDFDSPTPYILWT